MRTVSVCAAAILLAAGAAFAESLQIGDLIYVDTYNTPELCTTTQIDTNGRVTLPYVGLVHVAGLSEGEAAAAVSGAYAAIHKNPRVTISKTVLGLSAGYRTAEMKTELIPLMNGNAEQLSELLQGIASEGGSITHDPDTNMLIVTDHVSAIQNIMSIVGRLDQNKSQLSQVQIEAKIAEVKIGALKELGVRWFVQGNEVNGGYYPNPTQLPAISGLRGDQSSPLDNERLGGSGQGNNNDFGRRFINDLSPDRLLTIPAQIPKAGQLFFGLLNDNIDLGVFLDALVADDQAELLANPNLLAVNHKPAEIRMTDEVPYTEFGTEANGRSNFSVRFLDIGIIMKVTPHVLQDDQGTYIKLDLAPEVSFANGVRNGTPIRSVRSYRGQANVRNMQTLVIGGIYRNDSQNIETRVPVLGKVPVLGNLFKHTEKSRQQTELVIFVTPHLHETPDTVTWDRMLNVSNAAQVATQAPTEEPDDAGQRR